MGPKDLSLNDKIVQLKDAVQDAMAEEEKLKSDMYLYRWLRANKFDVKKTEKAITEVDHQAQVYFPFENLKWRQEEGIRELVDEEVDAELEAGLPYLFAEGAGGIPVGFYSGAVDTAEILEAFGKKRTLNHVAQVLVKQENLVHEFDKTWTGSVEDLPPERSMGCYVVCDVEDYSIKQNSSVKVLQYMGDYAKMLVNYFPAAGHVIMIVNATKLVEIPLQIVKPIVSGRLDLDIHGKDEEDVAVVSKVLDPQQLRELQKKAKEMLEKD